MTAIPIKIIGKFRARRVVESSWKYIYCLHLLLVLSNGFLSASHYKCRSYPWRQCMATDVDDTGRAEFVGSDFTVNCKVLPTNYLPVTHEDAHSLSHGE